MRDICPLDYSLFSLSVSEKKKKAFLALFIMPCPVSYLEGQVDILYSSLEYPSMLESSGCAALHGFNREEV